MEKELSPEVLNKVAGDILKACEHLEYSQAQLASAFKLCASCVEGSMLTKVMITSMAKLL